MQYLMSAIFSSQKQQIVKGTAARLQVKPPAKQPDTTLLMMLFTIFFRGTHPYDIPINDPISEVSPGPGMATSKRGTKTLAPVFYLVEQS